MTRIIGYISGEQPELLELYVKRIYTDKTKTYLINVNCSLKIIMDDILTDAHAIFGYSQNSCLELVEAGQDQSESAPAIELDSPGETFAQRFHNQGKNVAFYIRDTW
jgi:hypothetical protein